jgi:hypothetical protein
MFLIVNTKSSALELEWRAAEYNSARGTQFGAFHFDEVLEISAYALAERNAIVLSFF